MKTGTIHVYHVYGTKNDYCADVLYRGRVLTSFDKRHVLSWDSQEQGVRNRARAWLETNGFSHFKTIFGSAK